MKKKKKGVWFRLIRIMLILFLIGTIMITPIIIKGYHMYEEALSEMSLDDRINQVKEDDNYIIFDEIPEIYINQIILSEDNDFYNHSGIDSVAIMRALVTNIKTLSFAQGGSTISQQLAKNLCFSFDKNLERKIAEIFVAKDLERILTKNDILELYCNIAYFGESCYGLKEASYHYYDKDPLNLSSEESAALVYTLKSPNNYNPNEVNINN
jgi:membrane peptidoglycan carboxypeptidase